MYHWICFIENFQISTNMRDLHCTDRMVYRLPNHTPWVSPHYLPVVSWLSQQLVVSAVAPLRTACASAWPPTVPGRQGVCKELPAVPEWGSGGQNSNKHNLFYIFKLQSNYCLNRLPKKFSKLKFFFSWGIF